MAQIVGKTASYRIDQIEDRLRSIILSRLQDTLNEWGAKLNLPQLLAKTEEMASYIRSQSEAEFPGSWSELEVLLPGQPETF